MLNYSYSVPLKKLKKQLKYLLNQDKKIMFNTRIKSLHYHFGLITLLINKN